MPTLIHQRVRAAQQGQNPTVICRVPSGWAVIGEQQFIPGYCLLLADPPVADLNALDEAGRARFLLDMALIGDALMAVCGAYRINYEILGNSEPALHAHIFPRYANEPDKARKMPVWMGYSEEQFSSRPFDPAHDRPLMAKIEAAIQSRLA